MGGLSSRLQRYDEIAATKQKAQGRTHIYAQRVMSVFSETQHPKKSMTLSKK
jgi:hypothetical protein